MLLLVKKIARAVDFARENKIPIIIISKSGGARMMEAAYSLMQLAKTSAKLAQLGKEKIPYISLLTDPTFKSTASFSMLGDMNIAETCKCFNRICWTKSSKRNHWKRFTKWISDFRISTRKRFFGFNC